MKNLSLKSFKLSRSFVTGRDVKAARFLNTAGFGVLCAFLIALSALLYCFSDGISGNDFWWHVKAGEWIVKNQSVPQTDIFSWLGTNRFISWTAHEWLAEVIFYGFFSLSGEKGIYLMSLILAILFLFTILRYARNCVKKNILISGIFFCIFAVIVGMFFYGRPHIFSFFLLFFELKILYDFWEDSNSKKIWLIPLISCLWSNIHGGSSSISYILCIIFLIAGVMKFSIGKIRSSGLSKRAVLILCAVTAISFFALMVNPAGAKMVAYPYVNMGDSVSMTYISEWASPDAKDIGQLILFFLPIGLMLIGLWGEEKEIRAIDILVMGFFLFLFFRSQRFIVLWYIAAVFSMLRYVPEMRIKAIRTKLERISLAVLLAALLIATGVCSEKVVRNMVTADQLISRQISEEMMDYVKADDPQRLYNDYNLGGELIFNEVLVFVDGRADVYSAADHLLEDAISLLYLKQINSQAESFYVNVEDLVEKYGFDRLLVLKDRPLYSYILSHPESYALLFEDGTAGYFMVHDAAQQ